MHLRCFSPRPCVVPGCTGTMDFHECRLGAIGPAHWEFPRYASWRCRQDSSHVQLISHAEELELIRGSRTIPQFSRE